MSDVYDQAHTPVRSIRAAPHDYTGKTQLVSPIPTFSASDFRMHFSIALASTALLPNALPLLQPRSSVIAPQRVNMMADDTGFWSGKRVLIAGASSGLGEALAIDLSSRGANLVLAARRADRLTATADACPGAKPSVLQMDVGDGAAALEAKAAEAAKLLGGPVDVLCYAAGVGQRTLAIDTTADGHAQIMSANFEGAVGLSRAVLPGMIEQKSGHVMVVSSVQGFFGQPGRSSYAASKAAIIGYFDALRAEVAKHDVGVTVVVPGYIATDHAASAVGNPSGGGGAAAPEEKKGMPPEELATMIADAIEAGKPQLVASQLDGKVGMLLRTLAPGLLFKIMRGKAKKL